MKENEKDQQTQRKVAKQIPVNQTSGGNPDKGGNQSQKHSSRFEEDTDTEVQEEREKNENEREQDILARKKKNQGDDAINDEPVVNPDTHKGNNPGTNTGLTKDSSQGSEFL